MSRRYLMDFLLASGNLDMYVCYMAIECAPLNESERQSMPHRAIELTRSEENDMENGIRNVFSRSRR